MSKTASRLAIAAGVLVLVLIVAAVVVLGQLGRIVKHGVETVGPTLTGTSVTLDGARISVFSGDGALDDLRIGNPRGFASEYAFDLDEVSIGIDVKSVASDVIHIRSVVIDGPKLIAEFDASGFSNLKAILDKVRAGNRRAPAQAEPDSAGGAQPKLIIDEFRFENAEVRALAEAYQLDKTLKIAPVVLKNLGGKNGATPAAIAAQVLNPVVNSAVRAALNEYMKAKRGEIADKARKELQEKLFK